jgi:hypothetical protein
MHTLETCAALRCPLASPDELHTSEVSAALETATTVRRHLNGCTVTFERLSHNRVAFYVERGSNHVGGTSPTTEAAVRRAVYLAMATDETGAPNMYGDLR